jgi:hypothetical protein
MPCSFGIGALGMTCMLAEGVALLGDGLLEAEDRGHRTRCPLSFCSIEDY